MARSGTFGRLPRAVPSIGNTLIAIARQAQQQEDENIMSAWQKGGMVNGEKVTDKIVLAHWHDRLKDISRDDPLFDTYRNVITQYEYSIAESKKTAQYALLAEPSAGDDSAMASFYLNWSKRIPKDSEFYRVLQRDAGQYIRSAKAKQKQKAQVNETKVYNARMSALEKKNELPGQTVLKVINLLAQEGAVVGETPLGAETNIVNSTNIDQVGLPGVDQMVALLASVDSASAGVGDHMRGPNVDKRLARGNGNILYTDETGKAVTGADIHDMFKKLDPGFDGRFDLKYISGLLIDQREGLGKRIDHARKTGHISDMVQLQAQQAKVNEYAREVAAYPVAQEYNDLHSKMQAVLADNSLLPDAKVAAISSIRAQMGGLANDKRIADDTRMQTQLRAEAEGKEGVPTLGEDLTGTHEGMGYGSNTPNDIKIVNAHLAQFQEQKDLLADGTHVMTQGNYAPDPLTGKVVFTAQTGGPSVGAATMEDINNLPGAGPAVPVMVPNGDGGGATPMYVVPAPIYANATAADGTALDPTNKNPVGSFIRYPVNGVMTTMYGVTDAKTKQTNWTIDPTWDTSKVKTSFDSSGAMQLDLTAAVPPPDSVDLTLGVTEGGFKDIGGGFAVSGAHRDAAGNLVPGKLVYDPASATALTDPTRVHAGKDPFTDSFSASLLSLRNTPDGTNLLKQWTGDARFKDIIDQNAHLAAGQSRGMDAKGNTIWTGGNPSIYDRNVMDMNIDIDNAKSGQTLIDNPARATWDKDGTFAPRKPEVVETNSLTTKLPADVSNSLGADSPVYGLSSAFMPNSNKFKPQNVDRPGMNIVSPTSLKLPAYTPSPSMPAPMPTTATTGTNVPKPTTAAATTVPTSTGGYSTTPKPTQPSTPPPSGYHPI